MRASYHFISEFDCSYSEIIVFVSYSDITSPLCDKMRWIAFREIALFSIKDNKIKSLKVLKTKWIIIKRRAAILMNNLDDVFLNSENAIEILLFEETLAQINNNNIIKTIFSFV